MAVEEVPVKKSWIAGFILCSSIAAQAQSNPGAVQLSPALSPYMKLYQSVGVSQIWIRGNVLASEVMFLREALMSAPQDGLLPEYWTPSLEHMFLNFTPDMAEKFEVEATNALMKYATDLSTGRVNPESVSDEIKIKKKSLPFEKVAAILKQTTGDLKTNLESLAPQWPAYRSLKKALARLSSFTPAEFPDIRVPSKRFRQGDSDAAFAALKTRLKSLGYEISETGPTYTKELFEAVLKYYRYQTLPGSESLSPDSAFWKHVTVSLESRVQQIKLQMEKLRWVNNNPGPRYIYVNLGLQQFRMFDQGGLVMQMRTINGRSQRMSPMLEDQLTTVEFNPNWTVPARLIAEDKAPAIAKDPYYLERNNYVVQDRNGNVVPSWTIDWTSINIKNANQFYVRQAPGLNNALGIMKFHLTNPYAIYLHDTNERDLFAKNHRLLSSGCVRLEFPVELAYHLLQDNSQWNRPGAIEAALAKTPVAQPPVRVQNRVRLNSPVPVYLMYLTVEAEEGAPVLFANDYYGQDADVFNALKASRR